MPTSKSTSPRVSSRRAKRRRRAHRPGLHLPQGPPRSIAPEQGQREEPSCTPRADVDGRVAGLPSAAFSLLWV